jgi:hypothetical protein
MMVSHMRHFLRSRDKLDLLTLRRLGHPLRLGLQGILLLGRRSLRLVPDMLHRFRCVLRGTLVLLLKLILQRLLHLGKLLSKLVCICPTIRQLLLKSRCTGIAPSLVSAYAHII